MNIGVSGHQRRPEMPWHWIERTLRHELNQLQRPWSGYSALAEGTDQIFGALVIEFGQTLNAIIPCEKYESFLSGPSLFTYQKLLRRSQQIPLRLTGDLQQVFFDASRFIVDNATVMFIVWDGKPAQGLGGTADVFAYSRQKGRTIIHLNPLSLNINRW